MPIWGSYQPQHRWQTLKTLVANDGTIQNFNFLGLLENSEIKRQPIGNHVNEKKFK
jgi:hypothetical protein